MNTIWRCYEWTGSMEQLRQAGAETRNHSGNLLPPADPYCWPEKSSEYGTASDAGRARNFLKHYGVDRSPNVNWELASKNIQDGRAFMHAFWCDYDQQQVCVLAVVPTAA